jgi:hypothetical protein
VQEFLPRELSGSYSIILIWQEPSSLGLFSMESSNQRWEVTTREDDTIVIGGIGIRDAIMVLVIIAVRLKESWGKSEVTTDLII